MTRAPRSSWLMGAAGRALALAIALAVAPWNNALAQGATEVRARDMSEDIVRIPVTVSDRYQRSETRQMPITIFRPPGAGPFPLVIYNHGRSVAAKRAQQTRSRPEALARYLVAKGFVVLAPTRIGYWETYGDFDPEDSGSCRQMQVEPMAKAASDQVLATLAFARTLGYVDTSRWLVVGQSVGGLTSVATVARHPEGLLGGINFAGGTGGNPESSPGAPCSPEQISRQWSRIAGGASAPMLWLYWQNDLYWGEAIPKSWDQAWVGAGGKAEFHSLPPIKGQDGHTGVNTDMDHWLPLVDDFLQRLGFRAPAIVGRPAPTGFARLTDGSRVPVSASARDTGYLKNFLNAPKPRAFAVGERGAWGWAYGDYATGRALGFCQRSGQSCKLYAVDEDVVWQP